MKPEIIPAILVQDRKTFVKRLKMVEGLATCVQIDCMDGQFVQNKTWYDAEPLDTTLEIELHLMVQDPMSTILAWRRIPQVVRALWHVEIPVDHAAVIEVCRAQGWECGLALSPDSPVSRVAEYFDQIDEVLVLGVTPGWSGQTLLPSTIDKIRTLKKHSPLISVGFDGGVTAANLRDILAAGADRINIASAVFKSPDPRATLRAILSSI